MSPPSIKHPQLLWQFVGLLDLLFAPAHSFARVVYFRVSRERTSFRIS